MNRIILILCLLSSPLYAQDFKEEVAKNLEALGQELQSIQDEKGLEEAHQKLSEKIRAAFPILVDRIKTQIALLSEAEAQACVAQIQKNVAWDWVSEEDLLLIVDRSLTAKEKIKALYEKSLEAQVGDGLETVKKEAFSVGYQEVFQDLARDVRSRGYGYTGPNPNWRAILLLSSVLVVYAVVPPPVSAYLATAILGVTAYLEVRDFYRRLDDEEPIYFSPRRRDPDRKVIPYP
ncbi:MAG: hypothetical protein HYY62_08290 [Deltaproteobacteria bacterium]|nr:hypothetical protein [Deltaproteobacteria bacterium]